MKKNSVLISVAIIIVTLILVFFSFKTYTSLNITAKDMVELAVNEDYTIPEAVASIGDKDVSDKIIADNNIDINQIGDYSITYTIKYFIFSKAVKTEVNVVDKLAPTMNFKGNKISVSNGEKIDLSYLILDNYYSPDEILIEINDNVNYEKDGSYFINYKLIDPSKNVASFQREVIVDHDFQDLSLKSDVILNETQSPLGNYEFVSDQVINSFQNLATINSVNDLNQVVDYLFENDVEYLVLNIAYNDLASNSLLTIIDQYQKAIREIKTVSPKSKIYICSILPSFEDDELSNHDILIFNYYLLKMTENLNLRFLNVNEAFTNDENKTIVDYFSSTNTLSQEGIKVYNSYLASHLQDYQLLTEY